MCYYKHVFVYYCESREINVIVVLGREQQYPVGSEGMCEHGMCS